MFCEAVVGLYLPALVESGFADVVAVGANHQLDPIVSVLNEGRDTGGSLPKKNKKKKHGCWINI